jgi:glycosyltransferase involved in cell wall biosynthesis
MIRDGENGLLVDFYSPAEISKRVVDVLAAGRDGYSDIRQNARRTIVENYDLKTICLPAQLQLLEKAMNL